MTPVRLEPAALRSRVKHSTTEPLRSHHFRYVTWITSQGHRHSGSAEDVLIHFYHIYVCCGHLKKLSYHRPSESLYEVVCFSHLLKIFKKPLWQTVRTQIRLFSGSTQFASILNSSIMLGNYLQQTTLAEDIFKCIFFLAL